MKRIYQKEWFGINFKDFTIMSSCHVADSQFYEKFYQIFYDKFNSYDDLPLDYRQKKISVASDLKRFSSSYSEILSIGCGNGIIESYLANETNQKILAIEPSLYNCKWIQKNKNVKLVNGFFPEAILGYPKLKFGYSSNIDYVFKNEEYKKFLGQILEYNFDEFYLLDIITLRPNTPLFLLKQIIKKILIFLKILKYDKQQFWGYQRSIDEHLELIKSVGFNNIESGVHKHGSSWIRFSRTVKQGNLKNV